MRHPVLALATILAAAILPAFAQDEPPLFENPPAPEQAAPSPTPPQAAPSAPPASSLGPLPATLDFARWQKMTARERQTYVEGSVTILGAVTRKLRTDLAAAGRPPQERPVAVVRFVNDSAPRRAPAAYLREMERIYTTAEGQKLTMEECFQKAFERLNIPPAQAAPPEAAKTPAGDAPGQ
jgi:hypothetical protein